MFCEISGAQLLSHLLECCWNMESGWSWLRQLQHQIWESPNLTTLLKYTTALAANEQRNWIYGLLRMLRSSSLHKAVPELLKPDYNHPLAQVYRNLIRLSPNEHKTLYPLFFFRHRSSGNFELEGFQSWTPRLTGRGTKPKIHRCILNFTTCPIASHFEKCCIGWSLRGWVWII